MWTYQGAEYTGEDAVNFMGFVYLITNLVSGKEYVGKKLLWFSKTKTVKGKKKKTKVESDWRDYWSSSIDVKADVELLGTESFRREILYFCKNKGTMSYLEAREQFDRRVLEDSSRYYNGQIQCRIHHTHVKLQA